MEDFQDISEPKIEVIDEVTFTPPRPEKPKKEEKPQSPPVQEPKINIEKSKNDKNIEQKKSKGGKNSNPDSFFAKNKVFLIIIFALLLTTVVSVLVCYFMHKKSSATIEFKNNEFNNLQSSYDKINKNYKELQGKMAQLHSENTKLQEQIDSGAPNIGIDKRKEKINSAQNVVKNHLKEGAEQEFNRRSTAQSNYENHKEDIDEAIEFSGKKRQKKVKVEQVSDDEIENINMLVE
jgi:prefoldin subunit 5